MRHTFANKVASLFSKLPDFTEDIEDKWDVFKSELITSAASSCGCKFVDIKRVVIKKLLGGTKKLKQLSVQRKLRFELG